MKKERIDTQKAAKPVGAYPHARQVGDFLLLSGIGPRDAANNSIAGLEIDARGNFTNFDFEAQVHAVFKNVKGVLEAAGATMDDLVDITVFLVHMKRDFNTFNRVYAEYFGGKPTAPCRTTVEVKSLPTPIAIELKCMAYLPDISAKLSD